MTMPRTILPGTNLSVSRLGFGCVRLTTCPSEAVAQQTLHAALDNGITHFDTARLYGSGHSERILGEFLQGRRDRVTIATKLGLSPAAGLSNKRLVISLAKKVLRRFPGLLARAKRHATAGTVSGAFDVPSAQASLETSLRTLRTDYIDLLLLHEATLDDAASEPLQQFLEEQQRRGTLRTSGIGSAFEKLRNDAALVPPLYRVLQFENHRAAPHLDRLEHRQERAIITHGVFNSLGNLQARLAASPQLTAAASQRLNVDLADPAMLGSLLLHDALRANAAGAVLFSSMSPTRIANNARDAASDRFTPEQLQRFAELADQLFSQAAPQ